jgi:uncharacterized iron-regulated membrane protein
MKSLRKTIFWLHLIGGVTAGLIILLMSITGVILTYERQMLEAADTPSFTAPAGARLSVEQLMEKARAAAPAGAALSGLTLNSNPAVPASAAYGRETAWLHPSTGEKLEAGAPGLRQFFRTVTDLHRWIAMSGESRPTGKAITGAANLVFLFLVGSGLYLWFPRQWKWSAFRPVLWFRGKLSGRARDWNWHNVFGFWSCVPLFFIVVTAALISYPWATGLLYRAFGETPPAQAAPPQPALPPERSTAAAASPDIQGLNGLWAKVEAESPGWQSISLRLPADKSAVFTVMGGHRGRPDLRSTLTLDPQTGTVTTSEKFDDFSPARKTRTWGRWLHTGEAAGVVGQTIAGLASLAGVVLVWTGLALAWRRLLKKGPTSTLSTEH